jgi:2-(1,2-epoxy-1,2-dihydrophenyl)acetyl-CoA isomerase
MAFETIVTKRIGDVVEITLDRPERLNACSLAMADELLAALDDLGDARAVLITGAGRAFCSGADLQGGGVGEHASMGDASHAALTEHYNPLVVRLAELDLPVVCAVNGAAAGIGSSIALACDFVVAGTSAYFLQAFVNIGLIPDGGASWMLPRLIGKARATELMMLGEKLSAERAADWGLIHRCVADDALLDEARALAVRLAALPTVALGVMRANLRRALGGDLAATLADEADGQRRAANSADAMIGAGAFLAKTKPRFSGR